MFLQVVKNYSPQKRSMFVGHQSFRREEVIKMSKSVSFLYKLARLANDVEKLSSGDPKKVTCRAKNKYIGKKIIKKAWKFPW